MDDEVCYVVRADLLDEGETSALAAYTDHSRADAHCLRVAEDHGLVYNEVYSGWVGDEDEDSRCVYIEAIPFRAGPRNAL